MIKIGLIVGEDADLPQSIIRTNQIITFPFILDWKKYKEGENIYKLMRKTAGGGPKTSQPSIQTFTQVFEKSLNLYDEIIVITVSSKFSGTYNGAIQAKKKLKEAKRIHIVDSESSSGAEGLLVLKAVELIKKSSDVKLVCEELKKYAVSINLIGTFEDPKWLVAGGRVSKVKGMLVRNMLKGGFRPVLTIKEGEIVVKKIQINSKNPVDALFSQFKEDCLSDNKSIDVAITHADCYDKAKTLSKLIEKMSGKVKIRYINEISPVVGCHLGPDTLLLSWVYKN